VIRSSFRLAAALAMGLAFAPAAFAQDDAELKLAEQDFTLVSLPTSRFTRPLGQGDFGDLAGDLFGLDSGAQIGLEYRFGIIKSGQIGFHRTNDKDIMFFAQYGVVRQGEALPMDVSVTASVDGTRNFQDSYSPSVGVILSRTFGDRAALYFEPTWVNNTNDLPTELVDHNDTVYYGIGARVRIRPTVYLVGEFAPRTGNKAAPNNPITTNHGSFGIEKRAGGHTVQLNFSDSYATTRRQISQGGPEGNNWYFGFNISRKFF
jgi:hypothetical protein